MNTFDDIEEFRKSPPAEVFAEQWLNEQRSGDVAGDRHMDLLAWTKNYPHQALGIILTLLDKAHKDEATLEQIAMGDVERIVEWPEQNFVPILQEAIRKYPTFEICTRFRRQNSNLSRWKLLNIHE